MKKGLKMTLPLGNIIVDTTTYSSTIVLEVVGSELVFSVSGVSVGYLKIPTGWLPMNDDQGQAKKCFEVVEFENDIFICDVNVFVLFDKGAMHGKIQVIKDGIFKVFLGDWSEISYIPQGITESAGSPMITPKQVVYQIEGGTDEENGCGVAMLVVFKGKFTIFFMNMVFYRETPKIEAKRLDFPFPTKSFGQLITGQIDFSADDCGYFPEYTPECCYANFTIKIGEEKYNVSISFGAFKEYSVDHLDGFYKLSAIYNRRSCATIFCGGDEDAVELIPPSAIHHKQTCITFFCDGDEDAFEQMNHEMTRIGIFSIEIPEFVAPDPDKEYTSSELFDSLTHLPPDLQAFLRSTTWCKPDA